MTKNPVDKNLGTLNLTSQLIKDTSHNVTNNLILTSSLDKDLSETEH